MPLIDPPLAISIVASLPRSTVVMGKHRPRDRMAATAWMAGGIPTRRTTGDCRIADEETVDDRGDEIHVGKAGGAQHDVRRFSHPLAKGDLALVGDEEVDAIGQNASRTVGSRRRASLPRSGRARNCQAETTLA